MGPGGRSRRRGILINSSIFMMVVVLLGFFSGVWWWWWCWWLKGVFNWVELRCCLDLFGDGVKVQVSVFVCVGERNGTLGKNLSTFCLSVCLLVVVVGVCVCVVYTNFKWLVYFGLKIIFKKKKRYFSLTLKLHLIMHLLLPLLYHLLFLDILLVFLMLLLPCDGMCIFFFFFIILNFFIILIF